MSCGTCSLAARCRRRPARWRARSAACSDCSKQRFQAVCAIKCKNDGFKPVCAKVKESGKTSYRVYTNRCVMNCANEVRGCACASVHARLCCHAEACWQPAGLLMSVVLRAAV